MHTSAKISSISVLLPDGETWHAVKVLRCLNHMLGIISHVLAKTRLPPALLSRFCSTSLNRGN